MRAPSPGSELLWLSEILATVGGQSSSPSMLEVGSGDGARLVLADIAGIEPFGVQPGPHAGTDGLCATAYVVGNLDELPPHRFDLILLTAPVDALKPREILYALATKDAFGPKTALVMLPHEAWDLDEIAQVARELRFNGVACIGTGADRRVMATGSDFPQFMQERYVPGTWSEIAAYEHLPRYAFAAQMVLAARVLDFGCGAGYGSAALARSAHSVTGLDISTEALAFARAQHAAPNLEFIQDSSFGETLPEASFDVVVCFEVIEHLDCSTQQLLIASLRRLLAPSGRLLISTPNPNVTALYGANPYHLHELTSDEFADLLREHFSHVVLVDQSVEAGIFLRPQGASQTLEERRDIVELDGPAYPAIFLGVCSPDPFGSLPAIVYPDRARNLIKSRIDAISTRNECLVLRYELAKLGREAAAVLEDRALLNRTYEAAVAEKDRLQLEVAALSAELIDAAERALQVVAERALQVDELDKRFATTNHRLELIETSISWRLLRWLMSLLRVAGPVVRPLVRTGLMVASKVTGLPKPISPTAIVGSTSEVIQPCAVERDVIFETMLDPLWDEAKGKFFLKPDEAFGRKTLLSTFVPPYVVVPLVKINPEVIRPKVLHVIPNVHVGGSTQLVIDIVQRLSASYQHEIVTSSLWPGGDHVGLTVHLVAEVCPVLMTALIARIQPDLVHVHYWGLFDDPWYFAAVEAIENNGVPALQNVNTPVTPMRHDVFSHYVFVSKYVLDTFGTAAVGDCPMSIIHPGIDLARFGSWAPTQERDDAIGMVYRLEADKLNESSIEIFIEVVKRRPRTKVYIIGGGQFLIPYLERTEAAGVRQNFRFTGYVPYETLPSWYDRFAVFVAPVWNESFGQVAPFAMCKRSVVAGFAVGALSEILGSDETLSTTVSETADIIVRLLDDKQRLHELGKINHARALQMYDVGNMTSLYEQLYDQLLNRSQGTS